MDEKAVEKFEPQKLAWKLAQESDRQAHFLWRPGQPIEPEHDDELEDQVAARMALDAEADEVARGEKPVSLDEAEKILDEPAPDIASADQIPF